MNLSMKWLSDYIKIYTTPKEFAQQMTMSGSKVEGYEIIGSDIENVVVGKILSIEKHPDADKLVVCSVDVGKGEPIQIVTGATNVNAGDMVPVALDGSCLPGDKKIKAGKLRGVPSQGMLCSLGELKLTKNDFPYAIEDGIFILQEPCNIGDDIRTAVGLDDVSVEFEITTNRPDCLSIIGLAREVSATFNVPINIMAPIVIGGCGEIGDKLEVKVEDISLCTRYAARMVKNIKIEPSPRWIRERLRACGVRPINNIVDITNYVMLEYGHPMHAFDYRYLNGGKINVRRAENDETITTLDGALRKLTADMLVIADAKKPIAIAGIMGGEYSGIVDDTKIIVFEAACFNGTNIRITSKKLGLRSESSGRFEKGLDAQNAMNALQRACELVELLGAGEVLDGVIDIKNPPIKPTKIPLNSAWINQFLGVSIDENEMIRILKSLDFKIENGIIEVPSYRSDIEHKSDIAEEIARIYGYNNIPSTLMQGEATKGGFTLAQKFEHKIADTLISLGFSEIQTYSFISPKYYDKILLPKDSLLRSSVIIQNPFGEDTSIMRTTTLPSMLEVLSRNYNNRNLEAALYEIGTIYIPNEDNKKLPQEKQVITVGMYSNANFYSLKGAVEVLLKELSVFCWDIAPCTDELAFHPGRCAKLFLNGESFGIIGEIHPSVLANYSIELPVYAAMLDLNSLFINRLTQKQYKALPKFPAVSRDLALVCDESIPVIELEKRIRKGAGALLENVTLFDVYKGKQISDDKKSVAFSLIFRAEDRTLTDEEAEKTIKRILKGLKEIGVELRI
jgi:phenylalanyl-tRNA synthetase beta chain